MRNLLIVLGIYHLLLGVFMAAAPGTFYEEIAGYPPRSDHYIRDLATYAFALGAVMLVAARNPSWRLPVLAYAGLQYGLHVINHAFDVGETDPEWHGPANLVSLALLGLLIAWLWRSAGSQEGPAG
jgi:hypothetical protein